MKKLKVLFCGLGAVGQRHLRLIQKNYNKKFNIFYFKETNKEFLIKDDLTINKKVKSLASFYNIKKIVKKDLETQKFDIVFITNTPSKHIKHALKFAKKKSNIFIEKPLSINLKNLDKLLAIQNQYKINIHVGYNFKFHPLVNKVSQIINNKELGKIINSISYFGEFIPFAHKYENFRKSHYTDKLDGGATLGFCHNINLIIYFHKKIKKILYRKLENNFFKVKCDEVSIAILRGKNNELISMQNNFYSYDKSYFFIINFERGTIKLDLTKNTLQIGIPQKTKVKKLTIKNFSRNTMFEDQIISFLNNILRNKKFNTSSLIEAIETQKLISKIRD